MSALGVSLGDKLGVSLDGYVISKLVASNAGASDLLGEAVAVSGDGNTIVVGAADEDSSSTGINSTPNDSASNAGAAYVFRRVSSGWSQEAYLKASVVAASDRFGRGVAISHDGNTIAIGATSASGTGRVFVFTRAGSTWSEQQAISASNAGASDGFGTYVALSADGNTLAASATSEDGSGSGINPVDDNLASAAGAAYVFTRSAGVWSQQAHIKASNPGASDQFGFSLALSADGDTLAVGSPGEDSSTTTINSTPDELASAAGAVYVFRRVAGSWSQQAYVKAANAGGGDSFGRRVALSYDGDLLIAAASGEDGSGTGINPASDELASGAGAVYAFAFSAGAWSQEAYLKASNTGVGDQFGISCAMSANGGTLVVGANAEDGSGTGLDPTSDDLASGAGAGYLLFRSGSGWRYGNYVKATDTAAGDTFGVSCGCSADGRVVAICAHMEDGGKGAVYVYEWLY